MSQSLNEIQELFNQSNADPIIINDLLVFLPILPEDVLGKLVETFKENPESIEEFANNFKSKFEALSGQQSELLDDLEADMGDDEYSDDFGGDTDQDNFEEEDF